MEHTKWCNDCSAELSVKKFARDRRKKDGLQTYCKKCNSIRSAEWRKENPDKARESRKRSKKIFWQKEKETLADSYIRRLLARYSNRVESEFTKDEIELKRKKIILLKAGKIKRNQQLTIRGIITNKAFGGGRPLQKYGPCYLCGEEIGSTQFHKFDIDDKRSGYCFPCYSRIFKFHRINGKGEKWCFVCKRYLNKNKFKNKWRTWSCDKCSTEQDRITHKKNREAISDRYVKKILTKNSSLVACEISQDMIDLQRAKIKLRRAFDEKNVSMKI